VDLQYEISSKPIRIFVGIKRPDGQQNDTSSLSIHFMKGLQNKSQLQVHSVRIYCRDDRPLALLPNSGYWHLVGGDRSFVCTHSLGRSTSQQFTDPYFGKYINDITLRVHHKYGEVLLLRVTQSQERTALC
jgi:hypothetical protein